MFIFYFIESMSKDDDVIDLDKFKNFQQWPATLDCDGKKIDVEKLDEEFSKKIELDQEINLTPEGTGIQRATCQLGLLGSVLPSSLNTTLSMMMSSLNFQLVLARQHSETLQGCGRNWQQMGTNVDTLVAELDAIAEEAALHNFHLPRVNSQDFGSQKKPQF